MPAFPFAALDDVEGANQRAFSNTQTAFQAQLLSQQAGDRQSAELLRNSARNLATATDAVVTQALLLGNTEVPLNTLSDNAVARQPWDAPITPEPGPGRNPKPAPTPAPAA